jgi:hypothetical protein
MSRVIIKSDIQDETLSELIEMLDALKTEELQLARVRLAPIIYFLVKMAEKEEIMCMLNDIVDKAIVRHIMDS